jgi:hypothetical protein
MFTIRGLPWPTLAELAAGSLKRGRPLSESPLVALICIADHFEPRRGGASPTIARERVQRWQHEYPLLAGRFADSAGRPPQHSFFFPAEEYAPELIDPLAELCHAGWGDVEVHLHHDRDTSEGLREQLLTFTQALHSRHGLLDVDSCGRVTYGFIHGNWALDNSHPHGRWCGVNDELSVLLETGCYADFTMPSAPAACQTRTINSIYYAADDPARPKSHDRGLAAQAGVPAPPGTLLMVQGPLALDWRQRKLGLLPSLENGELTGRRPPTIERFQSWLAAGVHVAGRSDWRFIKLHTHGAWEANTAMLLGQPMRAFHAGLARLAASCPDFRYYYVTARELAAVIRHLERDAQAPDVGQLLLPASERVA